MNKNFQNQQFNMYNGKELLIKTEQALVKYHTWIIQKIITLIPKQKINQNNFKVLDFGGGIGTLSQIFKSNTGITPDIVEIDPICREYILANGFNCTTEIIHNYDVIFSSNVLEHIEDDILQLKKFNEKISDNGVLFLFLPALKLLWTDLDDNVGHYRRYQLSDLVTKVEASGFKVIEAHYCDCAGGLLALLFKLLRKRSGDISLSSLQTYDNYVLPLNKVFDRIFFKIFGKNVFLAAQKVKNITSTQDQ